jgi:CHAT domain-containing protein/Tfp pilus assembly protein PilF
MAITLGARIVLRTFASLLLIGCLSPSSVLAEDLTDLAKRTLQQYQAGRYADAEKLARQALSICERRFGQNSFDCAWALNYLAVVQMKQGRYSEAIPLYQRELAISEKALGPDHPEVAATLQNLAAVYGEQGRYADAIPLLQRALAFLEKAFGSDNPEVATALNNIGVLYEREGRYSDAIPLYQRALAIREKALGPDHRNVAQSLNSLAVVYGDQGRYADAIPLYERVLAIEEKVLGPEHPDTAGTLSNMALLYDAQGRHSDAVPLYQRALAIREKALGPNNPDVATSLNNLAAVYTEQGRYADAIPLYQRALAIREKTLGPDHPNVATTLLNLAALYGEQNRYSDAIPLLRRALAINEEALGANHPEVAAALNNLAKIYAAQGSYGDATSFFQQALAIREKTLGPDHLDLAQSLYNLADVSASQARFDEALSFSRRATAILVHRIEQGERVTTGTAEHDPFGAFQILIQAAFAVATQEPAKRTSLADEAFEAAQRAKESSAAAALAQMAARLGAGDSELSTLVREQQDLVQQWQALDKAIIAAVSRPAEQRDSSAETELRQQKADIENRLTATNAKLSSDFPEYATLANPKPLSVADTQQLLGSDEALILYLFDEKQSYVWAVTREGLAWERIDIGAKELEEKVSKLRESLDLQKVQNALAHGKEPKDVLFDVALANELYDKLLGRVEDTIKNKRQLLVVPSGALTSLPLQVLVTDKPKTLPTQISDYRNVEWLAKRQAVTVLPSVASLRALRVFAKTGAGAKPLVGYGNPVFNQGGSQTDAQTRVAGTTRAYTSYYRGTQADLETLRNGLPQLPETADELRSVAKRLGVPESEIHLGEAASESAVKHAQLDDYRIIYFATHGLVAGDIKSLAEPALALTLPKAPTDEDDGLLTASEVAQLKLNADWVVLSACNTAAGDKPGAEALSGLARAFFYAGARALLVSNWPVESDAAVRLTTGTFDALQADPSIGRSEALRRAMVAMIDDPGDPWNAYPAFWAPFIVVGEGGTAAQ